MTEAEFVDAAQKNPVNVELQLRLRSFGLRECHLTAGCLFQTVWRRICGRAAPWGIKEYDVFYVDDTDPSWEAEDQIIQRLSDATAELGVSVDVRGIRLGVTEWVTGIELRSEDDGPTPFAEPRYPPSPRRPAIDGLCRSRSGGRRSRAPSDSWVWMSGTCWPLQKGRRPDPETFPAGGGGGSLCPDPDAPVSVMGGSGGRAGELLIGLRSFIWPK